MISLEQISPVSSDVNADGHLVLAGVDVCDLVAEYGTPLYVMDLPTLRARCQAYQLGLSARYPDFLVAYAGKAHLSTGLLAVLAQEGLGVDVVSEGELYTAMQAGLAPEKIVFHGNNKSITELTLAVKHDIRLVVDNLQELENLSGVCAILAKKARILLRLKPGIEAHTHSYIRTGQVDSKFGMDLADMRLALETISQASWCDFLGFHGHIGSQIFQLEPYQDLVAFMIDQMILARDVYGLSVKEIDLGGGLGVLYTDADSPPSISSYLRLLATSLKEACEAKQLSLPKLIVEPGRSIVAQAGVTVYTAGTIKPIPGIRDYLFVDGGMADNMRPLLYQAEYTWVVANRMLEQPVHTYTIAGKFCESGDVLAKDIHLPEVSVGDYIVSYTTGAYNYSMASNYNRFCRPAVVLVGDGHSRLLVKRETVSDVLRFDVWGPA